MIQIAICDDQQAMLAELNRYVSGYFETRHLDFRVSLFSDGKSLAESTQDFDLIFLDIQMPGLSGMDTAQALRDAGKESLIVFVTVMSEAVYDAFSVEAADFLVKPIDPDRLERTLNRLCARLNSPSGSLLIRTSGRCITVKLSDILYCEVINRKIYVHTEQQVIDYYCRIEQLEKQLDSSFFKCHRSYLVNLRHVCAYENGMALLEGGKSIPVSRLRGQAFSQAILQYLKEGGI